MKDKSIVNYVNPKYLENVEVKMFRRRNSDPYKTNLTATFLHLWGPNVTVSLLIITIISITISAVGHLLSASPRDLRLVWLKAAWIYHETTASIRSFVHLWKFYAVLAHPPSPLENFSELRAIWSLWYMACLLPLQQVNAFLKSFHCIGTPGSKNQSVVVPCTKTIFFSACTSWIITKMALLKSRHHQTRNLP